MTIKEFKFEHDCKGAQYITDLTLDEMIKAFDGYIGMVYPNNGESYYVCSGGDYKLSYVVCEGGGFYGEREVCERLCTGEYKPSPTPQCIVDIADSIEKAINNDLKA